jgi:outer membrane lipopolysaccharide assembly protein LptE/RlpB
MRFYRQALIIAAATVALSGCYSFRGQTAGAIKSIAIPTFENESTEFGIAEQVTQQLTQGFQSDGTLRVTTGDQADAVLQGRILSVEDQPYSARADQTVEEYRFSLTCHIQLLDNKTQQPIWDANMTEWAIYPYTGSLQDRDVAIQEAVAKLQQDILNRIVGSW